ncbi:MAG TPA: pyridoxamine 5'-phosphate oxidase family protein [Candidatus Lokiarchaeia archaeon]|nr:pyridoxamine 5'-phosphate oxidase family protein [Candidatus Lokiarchaeia archaeon]
MPFKLEAMTPKEIKELVSTMYLSRIAFKGDKFPYIAPFQYVYMNGTLYFHFAAYGRKMEYLADDPDVCVEIENYNSDMSQYQFVTFCGTLEIVHEPIEKEEVVRALADAANQALFSKKFLAAHGFNSDMEWNSFQGNQAFEVIKLVNITKITGLRSPQGNEWG